MEVFYIVFSYFVSIVVCLILFSIYMLPSIFILLRKIHKKPILNRWNLVVFNFILGWTVVAWVISMIWSITVGTKYERAVKENLH
jgi:hypothetical protein